MIAPAPHLKKSTTRFKKEPFLSGFLTDMNTMTSC